MAPSSSSRESRTSQNSAAPDSSSSSGSAYVTELNQNDVLFGRGAPILHNAGNRRFRKLILENKPQYTATGRHVVKGEIARRILNTITKRGGRFLRRIESSPVLSGDQRVPVVGALWEIVDEETSLQKVKQALREQETPRFAQGRSGRRSPKKHAPQANRKRRTRPSSVADANNHWSSRISGSSEEKTEDDATARLQTAPFPAVSVASDPSAHQQGPHDSTAPHGDSISPASGSSLDGPNLLVRLKTGNLTKVKPIPQSLE